MEVCFIIDPHMYVSVPFEVPLVDVTMGDFLPIHLIYKDEIRYTLYSRSSDTWSAMLALKDSLEATLANKFEIPQGWRDLGYLWNQYLQHIPAPEFEVLGESGFWRGAHYVLWAPGMDPSTLLYNRNGDIIFQVVPVYCFLTHKIPYKVFIRNYRPYVTRIIPRAVAEEWLAKATEITDIMLANYNRDRERMLARDIGGSEF